MGISAREGLEPDFRVLFSAMFHDVSLGNFHQRRNLWKWAEAKVWSSVVKLPTKLSTCFDYCLPFHTSAILGPRTMQQLDDLLAGADISLSDEILDQIDEVVAPGADSGRWAVYTPPAVTQASLRRRPAAERGAA